MFVPSKVLHPNMFLEGNRCCCFFFFFFLLASQSPQKSAMSSRHRERDQKNAEAEFSPFSFPHLPNERTNECCLRSSFLPSPLLSQCRCGWWRWFFQRCGQKTRKRWKEGERRTKSSSRWSPFYLRARSGNGDMLLQCSETSIISHLYKVRCFWLCPPRNTTVGIGHITTVTVLTATEIWQWE